MTKTPVVQTRKRQSHVSGKWGWAWMHATKWGYVTFFPHRVNWLNISGFVVKTPGWFVTVMFRRRELKV